MELMTKPQRVRLIANFQLNQRGIPEIDHFPVIRLFTPDAAATWLLTEFDPCEELFFGLCDLGLGFPELGYVALAELEDAHGCLCLRVERDLHFSASKPLSVYAAEASKWGAIQL